MEHSFEGFHFELPWIWVSDLQSGKLLHGGDGLARRVCTFTSHPDSWAQTNGRLRQLRQGRPIRQAWNPLDDTASMNACLYHITLLNLDGVWRFCRMSSWKEAKRQSKEMGNLPGLVRFYLFCNANRGGVNSNLSQLQQSPDFCEVLWRRKCLLGAESWRLPSPHKM